MRTTNELATDPSVRRALERGETDALPRTLEQLRRSHGLDVLLVLDSSATVTVRARNPEIVGDDWKTEPVVRRVLAGVSNVANTVVFSAAELQRESPELAARARIESL